ncbi:uncharacterized protein LOC125745660 [Brienomyrus brachyistius]|uniref:uncharacterized protein LOC125745660 n=1 Tax=Brienomyrus brachyistius TaxID=42636 RepID=UPI0020B38E9A|nr:uncharacterized protein LOC125745660 [Brienomyrus brachyistius]
MSGETRAASLRRSLRDAEHGRPISARDSCRVCGNLPRGSLCRWMFSPSGRTKLQVALSYALGCEVARDGRCEFLCGKCAHMLERVLECRLLIGRLQVTHRAQEQKLQVEKENLIRCISHLYRKHNECMVAAEGDCAPTRSSSRTSVEVQIASEGSVSEEQLSPARSCDDGETRAPAAGSGSQPMSLPSQHMYMEVELHKSSTSALYQKRSSSIQSLTSECSESRSLPGSSGSAVQKATGDSPQPARPDPVARFRRGHLQGSPFTQTFMISDVLSLLRSIPRRALLSQPKSKIPILTRSVPLGTVSGTSSAQSQTETARNQLAAEWDFLQDLTDAFNDEYTVLKAEVT